jgi:hypothetical protein
MASTLFGHPGMNQTAASPALTERAEQATYIYWKDFL